MENWRDYKKVLLPDIPNLNRIDVYTQHGGYEMLRKVVTSNEWDPRKVIDEVKAASIRGRGGAGFNAGLKWSFMPPKKRACPATSPATAMSRSPAPSRTAAFMNLTSRPIHRRGFDRLLRDGNGSCLCLHPWRIHGLDRCDAACGGRSIHERLCGQKPFRYQIWRCLCPYGCRCLHLRGRNLAHGVARGQSSLPKVEATISAQYGLWGKPTTINNIETR